MYTIGCIAGGLGGGVLFSVRQKTVHNTLASTMSPKSNNQRFAIESPPLLEAKHAPVAGYFRVGLVRADQNGNPGVLYALRKT
jgi:hypothetical protein